MMKVFKCGVCGVATTFQDVCPSCLKVKNENEALLSELWEED